MTQSAMDMSYKVQLEKQVYIAGQTISGKLICNFAKNKNVYSLKIRVIGEELVKSQEELQIGIESVENNSVTSNMFLKTDMVVYTGGTISQGQYEFQFDITLPDVLPSSYKNEFGSIRYFLFGIYNELQACQKTKEEFTLINIIDLNALPLDMFEPTSYQSERELSFCCCGNGILSMEMFLGKKAFTTGEVATVKIKLRNTSTARSKGLKLELVEKVTACVPERSPRSRIYRKVLSRAGCLINFPRGENVFNLPLMIPENFAILKFDGSTLWKVEYLVVATCLLSSWHTDVVVNSEVTIGHIETRRRTENPPSYTERDSAPPPYSTLPRNPEDRIMIAETNM